MTTDRPLPAGSARGLGVLFDMDGVLLDSKQAHFDSWRVSALRRGLVLDQELYNQLFGQSYRIFIDALGGQDLGEEEGLAWYREKEDLYRELVRTQPPVMPGVEHLLCQLDEAGFALAIGSAGPRENVALARSALREGGRFRACLSADDVAEPKPAPDVFVAAARALGLRPEACAVVEDSLHGLEAAQRAGCARIALVGTESAAVLARHADLVVERLDELDPDRIARLIATRPTCRPTPAPLARADNG